MLEIAVATLITTIYDAQVVIPHQCTCIRYQIDPHSQLQPRHCRHIHVAHLSRIEMKKLCGQGILLVSERNKGCAEAGRGGQ
jgi:hypothetical protein